MSVIDLGGILPPELPEGVKSVVFGLVVRDFSRACARAPRARRGAPDVLALPQVFHVLAVALYVYSVTREVSTAGRARHLKRDA